MDIPRGSLGQVTTSVRMKRCCSFPTGRVSGKKYGREDAVSGWLEELEREPGTRSADGAESKGTSMADASPYTPAQHSGDPLTPAPLHII